MPIGIAIKAGQLAAPHVANATPQIGHAVAPHIARAATQIGQATAPHIHEGFQLAVHGLRTVGGRGGRIPPAFMAPAIPLAGWNKTVRHASKSAVTAARRAGLQVARDLRKDGPHTIADAGTSEGFRQGVDWMKDTRHEASEHGAAGHRATEHEAAAHSAAEHRAAARADGPREATGHGEAAG